MLWFKPCHFHYPVPLPEAARRLHQAIRRQGLCASETLLHEGDDPANPLAPRQWKISAPCNPLVKSSPPVFVAQMTPASAHAPQATPASPGTPSFSAPLAAFPAAAQARPAPQEHPALIAAQPGQPQPGPSGPQAPAQPLPAAGAAQLHGSQPQDRQPPDHQLHGNQPQGTQLRGHFRPHASTLLALPLCIAMAAAIGWQGMSARHSATLGGMLLLVLLIHWRTQQTAIARIQRALQASTQPTPADAHGSPQNASPLEQGPAKTPAFPTHPSRTHTFGPPRARSRRQPSPARLSQPGPAQPAPARPSHGRAGQVDGFNFHSSP